MRGVDGSNEHCFERQTTEFDAGTAAWSPDGSQVAIAETHVLGLEPGIWLLDVSSGGLTNLTDDGVERELSFSDAKNMPDNADIDVFPVLEPGRLRDSLSAQEVRHHDGDDGGPGRGR